MSHSITSCFKFSVILPFAHDINQLQSLIYINKKKEVDVILYGNFMINTAFQFNAVKSHL
jgi:hypothetical protein